MCSEQKEGGKKEKKKSFWRVDSSEVKKTQLINNNHARHFCAYVQK